MKQNVFNFTFRLSMVFILSMLFCPLYAQKQNVSGVVKDQSGEPLVGVNVVQKGTTNGTITDMDGKYSLAVNKSKVVLIFSYIGYITQEIAMENNKSLQVIMKEDTEELDEVVVVGYGTAKKRDLTGAISTVKAEKLEAESPRSVQDSASQRFRIVH